MAFDIEDLIQLRQHMDVSKAHIERAEGLFAKFELFMERAEPLLAQLEATRPASEALTAESANVGSINVHTEASDAGAIGGAIKDTIAETVAQRPASDGEAPATGEGMDSATVVEPSAPDAQEQSAAAEPAAAEPPPAS